KNMIAAWARRFPSLNGLETLQPYAGDVACEVAGEIHLRSLHMDSAQKGMNRWLVPNKLTAQSNQEQVTDEYCTIPNMGI
ncbi:hypothetical protein V3594_42825, partial [Bradyrhizobium diazoefficiens]